MKILLDSDALYAFYVEDDASHARAMLKLTQYLKSGEELFLSNLVLQEVTTVFSKRLGQKVALGFLEAINKTKLTHVFVNKELTAKTWAYFKKQMKKGTSFVDCSNVVICRKFGFDKIFSFDRFYQQTEFAINFTQENQKGSR